MTVLDEVIARLALGLPLEIVRDKVGRLRVYRPNPADFYELPRAAWRTAS